MGLPALLIPRSLKNEIVRLLLEEGIDVEEKPSPGKISVDGDISDYNLVCSTKKEKPVELQFAVTPEIMERQEMLVVVLRHTSPSWFGRSQLINELERILRANGAIDLPPHPKK